MPSDETRQMALNGGVQDGSEGTNPGGEADKTRSLADVSIDTPVCCVDDCETEVPGLMDGWEPHNRDGVACNDCWDYYDRHHHWRDEAAEAEHCVECMLDAGHVRHDCPEWGGDSGSVILDPPATCEHCGAEFLEDGGDGCSP